MNTNEAVKILWANACCTLGNACDICPFSNKVTNDATPNCENMNDEQLRETVQYMSKQKHKVNNMLTVSTAHIKPKTAKWLERQWEIFDSSIIVFSKGVYGWFVFVDYQEPEEVYEELPEDLTILFRMAVEYNCDWLCLDRDADIVPDLPVYEW